MTIKIKCSSTKNLELSQPAGGAALRNFGAIWTISPHSDFEHNPTGGFIAIQVIACAAEQGACPFGKQLGVDADPFIESVPRVEHK